MKACEFVNVCVCVSVLHPKGHHSVQLTSHNQRLHMQKSNHPLSASAADTQPQSFAKKDGLLLRAAADVKIHLSYSTKRGPIACLRRAIMTDVAVKVTPHFFSFFNQIDVPPSNTQWCCCCSTCDAQTGKALKPPDCSRLLLFTMVADCSTDLYIGHQRQSFLGNTRRTPKDIRWVWGLRCACCTCVKQEFDGTWEQYIFHRTDFKLSKCRQMHYTGGTRAEEKNMAMEKQLKW